MANGNGRNGSRESIFEIAERQEYPQAIDKQIGLPSEADQAEEMFARARQRESIEGSRTASARRYMEAPQIGKLVIPARHYLYEAHKKLTAEEDAGLAFSAANYPLFDGVIAKEMGVDALSNSDNKEYEKFAAMRRNIAVLRNIVYMRLFPDGSYDAGDHNDVIRGQQVQEMAKALGAALSNDRWYKPAFKEHMSRDIANQEDKGALAMYRQLLKFQNARTAVHPLAFLLSQPNFEWNLLPVEKTPFHDLEIGRYSTETGKTELAIDFGSRGERLEKMATMLLDFANHTDHMAATGRVEDLDNPVLDRATGLGRDILTALKADFSRFSVDEKLKNNPDTFSRHARDLVKVAEIYKDSFAQLIQLHPEMRNDPALLAANNAIGKLGALTLFNAISELNATGDEEGTRRAMAAYERLPEARTLGENETMPALVARLEAGLDLTHAMLRARLWERARSAARQETGNQPAQTATTNDPVTVQLKRDDLEFLKRHGLAWEDKNAPKPAEQPVIAQVGRHDLELLKQLGISWGPEPAILQANHPAAASIARHMSEQRLRDQNSAPVLEPTRKY